MLLNFQDQSSSGHSQLDHLLLSCMDILSAFRSLTKGRAWCYTPGYILCELSRISYTVRRRSISQIEALCIISCDCSFWRTNIKHGHKQGSTWRSFRTREIPRAYIYIYIYIYIKRDIREIYKREIIIRIVKDRMLRYFWHIV